MANDPTMIGCELGSDWCNRPNRRRTCRRNFSDLLGQGNRNPQKCSRRANRFDGQSHSVAWRTRSAPHVREFFYRGIRDFKSLKGADIVGFNMLMAQLFRIYEEMYYQQLEGHLDPRVWRGAEAGMRELIGYPGIQVWWRLHSHWFDKEFAKFINQQQQTAKAPRLFREANDY
jgi:hypothetical protein